MEPLHLTAHERRTIAKAIEFRALWVAMVSDDNLEYALELSLLQHKVMAGVPDEVTA
jgi:hypothetical protein